MIDTVKSTFCGSKKGRFEMQSITKEYLLLFNAITNAEESLSQLRSRLIEAQRQAEELFLEADDNIEEQ